MQSIDDHAAQMWRDKHLPAVGPTEENAPFNLTEKTTGMLNELENAHIYIEQLNNAAAQRNKQIEQLEKRLSQKSDLINNLITRMKALEDH